jgi:hypothetical protein
MQRLKQMNERTNPRPNREEVLWIFAMAISICRLWHFGVAELVGIGRGRLRLKRFHRFGSEMEWHSIYVCVLIFFGTVRPTKYLLLSLSLSLSMCNKQNAIFGSD